MFNNAAGAIPGSGGVSAKNRKLFFQPAQNREDGAEPGLLLPVYVLPDTSKPAIFPALPGFHRKGARLPARIRR